MDKTSTPPLGRVLFADDDRAAREGLTTILRRFGYECECAASADEALALAKGKEFEALISDIHMPGPSGLELTESIQHVIPGLHVILLTGRPSVDTAARSVRLPVAAYLTKPPDLEELRRVLDQAIADYRVFRAMREARARLRAWESELEQVQRTAKHAAPGGPMQDYLQVSLRQVILMLVELEKATMLMERKGGRHLTHLDHVAALRRTVEVLHGTRQNFKSKELADLRREIEQLLAGADDAADHSPQI